MPDGNWYRVIDVEDRLWVDNGKVGVELRRNTGGGHVLHHISNLQSGAVFCLQAVDGSPWWELEWRDRAGFKAVVTSQSPSPYCHSCALSEDEQELLVVLHWQALSIRQARYGSLHVAEARDPGGSADTVEVEVRLRLRRNEPLTRWSMAVRNRSTRYTLWRVTFIRASDVHRVGAAREDDFLTLPADYGWDMSRPVERRVTWTATYPSNQCVMQFLSFRNANHGLYMGWHDAKCNPKTFQIRADAAGHLAIAFAHMPENMTQVQPAVTVEGLVLGVFTGDWYDAASIYRSWALEQWWTSKGPVADRTDVPDWLKGTVLWWCLSSGKDTGSLTTEREILVQEVGDLALRLHERFPYPTAVHWYNWHPIPFNTSFPDYLPAKPGFADQVARLAADGIRVMPYINARFIDPNSRTWQEDEAERFCARKSSPRCEPHHYPITYELYPGEQYVVPMCSATSYWQEKVASIVRQMREQLGIRIIYLDQIAAAVPPLCFAPDHGHPQGGGDYGVRGYIRLLELVQQAGWSDEGPLALATESNAEPFMAGAPAYLMPVPSPDYQIPLFPAVYAGYVITFGRPFYDPDLQAPDAFAAKVAQMFTWGSQLGWIRNSIAEKLLTPEYSREAAFLDALCRAFASGRRYLVEGQMLRPPQPVWPIDTLATTWYGNPVRLPKVMATLWRSQSGEVALAVANVGNDTASVCYRLDLPKDGSVHRWEVQDLTGAGVVGKVDVSADRRVEVTLLVPGRSAAMIALSAADDQ